MAFIKKFSGSTFRVSFSVCVDMIPFSASRWGLVVPINRFPPTTFRLGLVAQFCHPAIGMPGAKDGWRWDPLGHPTLDVHTQLGINMAAPETLKRPGCLRR